VNHDGSLSLETALTMPVVALAAFALLQLTGVMTDAIAVREAAATAARTAATTTSDAAVHAAASAAVGDDRGLIVSVAPARRRGGTLIRVEVRLASRFGPLRPTLTATAAARGEPVLGNG
jgi:Flp pilus assembly protein TadG